jgi:hypothetical protein
MAAAKDLGTIPPPTWAWTRWHWLTQGTGTGSALAAQWVSARTNEHPEGAWVIGIGGPQVFSPREMQRLGYVWYAPATVPPLPHKDAQR